MTSPKNHGVEAELEIRYIQGQIQSLLLICLVKASFLISLDFAFVEWSYPQYGLHEGCKELEEGYMGVLDAAGEWATQFPFHTAAQGQE